MRKVSKNDFADKFVEESIIITYYLPLDEDGCEDGSVSIAFDDKYKNVSVNVCNAYGDNISSNYIPYDKMVEFCNKIIKRLKS